MSNQKQKTGKKPDPCPFCGGKCSAETVKTEDSETCEVCSGISVLCYGKDGVGCGYQSKFFVKEADAIASHNRVCREVETAAKQSVTDCNHLGNEAKMREALVRAQRVLHCAIVAEILKGDNAQEALNVVTAALSTPQRNCDVLSKDEVFKVLDDRSFSKEDTIEWLYAEAKGETK